jgi:predicted CXXCH cytochrome family protein
MKNLRSNRFVKAVWQRLTLLAFILPATTLFGDSVVNSVHNLSVSGPGTVKASSQTAVCVFCHTVHRGSGETPLWSHSMSGITNYIVYSSPTLKAVVGQPNGSSRLCLSCHDGTVALGSVNDYTSPIQMQNGVTTMPSGSANLGTDLSGDHPVSFQYNDALVAQDPTLNNPVSLIGPVKLDSSGQVQCDSCHDPHNDQFGNFLVMDNSGSALCLSCHNSPTWPVSAHAVSSRVLTPAVAAQLATPKPVTKKTVAVARNTVAAMACESCHVSHRAGGRQFLMKFEKAEQNCLVCHDGQMSRKNVAADFQKFSVHPVMWNNGEHNPAEDPVNPTVRQVTCADCHDPHAANVTKALTPNASGAIAGVVGVSASGAVIKPIRYEYELCYRCHADSLARGPATVTRQFIQTNTRLQFFTANQSFHPVVAQGRNVNVPSLIAPWLTSSIMSCTDCHNSDQSPGAGGVGANGPHGSIYAPILERNLNTVDFQIESPVAYDLCYKCHSRDSILANQSFKFHNSHVVTDQAACTTCHDSHGVEQAPHLINFNVTYVTPSTSGRIQYVSTGMAHGNCTLMCHGHDHENTPY